MRRYPSLSRKLSGNAFAVVKREPWACAWCDGEGTVMEQIDDDRLPVPVPCFMCRKHCAQCNKWVKKSGHICG
jgi:hypothetical protein